MDKFGLALRTVVFFLFPVPFLLSFAVAHNDEWTGAVAYAAIAALVLAAAAAGWLARRGGRE